MSYLPSLPDDSVLVNVYRAFPGPVGPLLEYQEALLRDPSPLTVAERELIAAYVSGLNACGFCHGVHQATAEQFGLPEGTVAALLDDPETADVDPKLRPVLRYVRKLTETPSRVAPSDVQAVLDSGWEEQAVHDAASICGLFNLMNRIVDGLGVTAGADYFAVTSKHIKDIGYKGLQDYL